MSDKVSDELNPAPDPAALLAAARAVPDPELPVLTLGDLGVIRDLRVAGDGAVEVDLTPTYTGCPATAVIADDVRTRTRIRYPLTRRRASRTSSAMTAVAGQPV